MPRPRFHPLALFGADTNEMTVEWTKMLRQIERSLQRLNREAEDAARRYAEIPCLE